jgi:hypothetical protein
MWTLTTLSLVVGGALGLRFNMFILVPTIGLALIMVAVTGMARGDGVWSLMATLVVVTIFLQLGYFGGTVLAPAIDDDSRASMPTLAGRPDPPDDRTKVAEGQLGPPL